MKPIPLSYALNILILAISLRLVVGSAVLWLNRRTDRNLRWPKR